MNIMSETGEREALSALLICCKNSSGLDSSKEETFWHRRCSVSGLLLGDRVEKKVVMGGATHGRSLSGHGK